MKEKKLDREGDITGLIEVNFQGGFLLKRYASREAFGFEMNVLGLTRRPTTGWFQNHMRKFNYWISQLPVKGTQFAVHVL